MLTYNDIKHRRNNNSYNEIFNKKIDDYLNILIEKSKTSTIEEILKYEFIFDFLTQLKTNFKDKIIFSNFDLYVDERFDNLTVGQLNKIKDEINIWLKDNINYKIIDYIIMTIEENI